MYTQVVTTNRCQNSCKFCFGKYSRQLQDMKFEDFKQAVDFILAGVPRISNVDLTPVVGEFFIKNRIKEMEYLESKRNIENYDMVTNLLDMSDEEMDFVLGSKKTELYVSIYGYNLDSYRMITENERFSDFEERLSVLYKKIIKLKETPKITFIMRHGKLDEMPTVSRVFKIIKGLMITRPDKVYMDEHVAHGNYTWAGQLEVENPMPIPKKKGICLHSIVQTAILPDKDITLCGLIDVNKKLIIGNAEQKFEDVYGCNSLYRDIIEKQKSGKFPDLCLNCNEYEFYLDEPEMLKKHFYKNDTLRWMYEN